MYNSIWWREVKIFQMNIKETLKSQPLEFHQIKKLMFSNDLNFNEVVWFIISGLHS